MNGEERIIIKVLIASPLFDGISRDQIEKTLDDLHPVLEQYRRDEILVREGARERVFGIVRRGSLHGEKFHEEGDIHLVSVFEPGDLFSLDSVVSRSRIAPLTLTATEGSEAVTMDIDQLLSLPFSDVITRNFMQILADENIRRLYKLDIFSRPGLRARILTYLKIMSQKHHGRPFHTMMTQEQMASFLAVNRSALSNELNKMRREGIIDFQKDRFVLLK